MCFNSILFSSLQGGWERNEERGRGGGESKGEQPPRGIWRKLTDVLVSIFSVPGALPTLSDFITTIILHCRLFYFHQRNWNPKSFGNIPRIAQLGSCRARILKACLTFHTSRLGPPERNSSQMGINDPSSFQCSSLNPLSHWGRLVTSKIIQYWRTSLLHPSRLRTSFYTWLSFLASMQI